MRWRIVGGITLAVVVAGGGFVAWMLRPAALLPSSAWTNKAHIADPDSLRMLAQGAVVGFADKYDTQGWLGIPFAAPPIGELRWRAPRSAQGWSGTRQAVAYGSTCPQFTSPEVSKLPVGAIEGREDCLYLNVWAPRFAPAAVPTGADRLPVMVWIHGGGHSVGSANMYGAARALAGKHKVIAVTVNYRLGLLGWFHHPALYDATSSAEDRSGNYGTLDNIEALRWVKANIATFGGDPDRVTIFGQSAGAASVFDLLTSPLAKGLFQRAISESGNLNSFPFSAGENLTDQASPGYPWSSNEVLLGLLQNDNPGLNRDGAHAKLASLSPPQIAAYLRGKSPQDLLAPIAKAGHLTFGVTYLFAHPFRDGTVLPAAPAKDAFATESGFNHVPVIIGTNLHEYRLFLALDDTHVWKLFGLIPQIRDKAAFMRDADAYTEVWRRAGAERPARELSALGGAPVFVYRFEWAQQPSNFIFDGKTLFGGSHGIETAFTLGEPDGSLLELEHGLSDENAAGREFLTDAMSSYWAQFAYSGDPGKGQSGSLPQWKPWSADAASADRFMVFDDPKAGGVRMSADTLSADGPADMCVVNEQYGRLTPGSLCGPNLRK